MESGEEELEVERAEGSGGAGGAVVGRCFFGGRRSNGRKGRRRLRNEGRREGDSASPGGDAVVVTSCSTSSLYGNLASTTAAGAFGALPTIAAVLAMIHLGDPFVLCHFEAV